MAELNGSEALLHLTHENRKDNGEDRRYQVVSLEPAMDDSMKSNEKSDSNHSTGFQSIPKNMIYLGTDRNSLEPAINDSMKSNEKSISEDSTGLQSIPKAVINSDCDGNSSSPNRTLPRIGSRQMHDQNAPGSLANTLDPTDALLNPDRYIGYEQCIDTTETVADILAKQFDNVKDFARDRTVFSLGAGERAVIWTYKKLKYLSRRWFTHFVLLLIVLVYSVIGASIFMVLEAPYEKIYDKQLDDVRREMAIKLEMIVKNETLMKTNPDFFELIQKDLIAYEDSYSECLKHVNDNNTTKNSWTFWNSMVFAGTIYTTIGYGHITPKTTAGRAVTICYAIIGVPLFLIVLTDFGKLLTRTIKLFWAYIRHIYYTRSRKNLRTAPVKKGMNNAPRPPHISDEDNIENRLEKKIPSAAPSVFEIDEEFNLPITLAIFLLIFYMICGACFINYWESWGFFESFYFVFISMSTIGLGDFVSHYPIYIYLAILYIIFGLSLTSMCINVVQQKISDSIKKSKLVEIIESTVTEDNCSLSPTAPVEIAPVHKPKSAVLESVNNENKDNDAYNK